MIVIYAEKPDVGNKIAAALGEISLSSGKKVNFSNLKINEKAVKSQQFKDGYLKIKWKGQDCYVTWGYGHLCGLKQAKDYDSDYKNWSKMPLPFIPSKYEVKVKDEVKKQYNLIKGLFLKSDLIINATDPDREGELIFAYLYEATKVKKPFKRAHFTSQTKDGIKEAFNKLKSATEVQGITDAGRGRSLADWIIGSNLTVAMTLKYNSDKVLSVGRVQTPTLNMLVNKEKDIRNFKPEPYYTISALFTTKSGEKYKATHNLKRIDNQKDSANILKKINGKNGIVSKINKRNSFRQAPNLYSLSSLQMAANSKYGFTLAKTLDIAQKLYEAGYITYPRTDSEFLTEDMEPVVNQTLDLLSSVPVYNKFIKGKARKFNKSKYFNNKKVNSHFAIIPVSIPKGVTQDESRLFDMISRSVIMMLYGPAKLEETTITTTVNSEDFISKGSVIKEASWLTIQPSSKEVFLPQLVEEEVVDGIYEENKRFTQPPKKYTDKTLVSAMIASGKELEDSDLRKIMADPDIAGIGTSATRASIIEHLVFRGYAKREKKNIVATDKGIALIDALPLEEIKSAELTAKWETRLNEIANNKYDLKSFVKEIEKVTDDWCKKINATKINPSTNKFKSKNRNGTNLNCPLCNNEINKYKWGWGCSNYKGGCKFSIGAKIAGKKLSDNQFKMLIEKGSTAKLKGFINKKNKPFESKLILEKGEVKFKSD